LLRKRWKGQDQQKPEEQTGKSSHSFLRAKGISLCPLACVVSFDYFAKCMTEDKQNYYGSQA
jgi:hypothetical protein